MLVHESLDRLERAYDLLVDATLDEKSPDAAEILFLRRRFAVEFRSFLLAVDGELRNHGALHAQLRTRAETLRIRLMSYTLAWQPSQIEDDPVAYRAAAEEIAETVRRFIADARERLEKAGIA